MHRVADEFVDHADVREPNAGDPFEIVVERGDQRLRLGPADHAGEALDIREESRDFAPLAEQLRFDVVGDDAPDHRRREMALETGAQTPRAPTRRRAHDGRRAAKPAIAGRDVSAGSKSREAPAAQTAAGNGAASAIAATAYAIGAAAQIARPVSATPRAAPQLQAIRGSISIGEKPARICRAARAWIVTEAVSGSSPVARSPPASGLRRR